MSTTHQPQCLTSSPVVERPSCPPFAVPAFKAAARFAIDIWDHRPRVRAGQDPFDFVPAYQRQIGASSYHLAVALGRPGCKESEWYQSLDGANVAPSMKKGLAMFYQAIDWAKEQTLDQQRLGGSLRTAFIFLQEGLWEIYHSLSGSEQDDVRALLAGIQERWGWKETYEDGAEEDSLTSAQQPLTTPGPEVLVGRSPSDLSFGFENSTPGKNLWRREGNIWTLTFAGKSIRLKDINGLRVIAELLAKKGQAIPGVQLEQSISGRPRENPSSGTEVLDDEARKSYKNRYEELVCELEEAKKFHDVGRQEQLQLEKEELERELSAKTGLRGRKRRMGDDNERIRKAVSNAIDRAIKAIEKEHPMLARHLDNSISKGIDFCYCPEADVDWVL